MLDFIENELENEVVEGENERNLVGNEIIWISVEGIMPNRSQPRRVFDREGIEELAKSVGEFGILQPIVVRECGKCGENSVFKYELVAGERRLRAARMVGMDKIPCVLVDVEEEKSAELAIIENLHRKNLNFFEIAAAISSLIEVYGMTQEQVARKMSLSQPAIANKLRLLRFSEFEREFMLKNNLTERHARCLLRVSDLNRRKEVLEKVVLGSLSVDQTEKLVDKVLSGMLLGDLREENKKKGVKNAEYYVDLVQKAVKKMRDGGFEAKSVCTETDEFYICTITVEKNCT